MLDTAPSTAPSTDLIDEIREDIDHNRLQLPTLPEVALRVRDAVESDDADAKRIAEIVACDPALAARLLQVANSPLYGGRREIDGVQEAVTRLGLKLVRGLVTNLVMKQMFQATSETLDRQLRRIWEDSVKIAAISRWLATQVPALETDEAMLGGLVHNIGALPLLAKLESCHIDDSNPALILAMIDALAPDLGTRILEQWHFVEGLTRIPAAVADPAYDSGPSPTYADIVIVARLLHHASQSQTTPTEWGYLPALAKLGMHPEELLERMADPASGIAEAEKLLGV
jgi:HD-like signal output (HDOD) protein